MYVKNVIRKEKQPEYFTHITYTLGITIQINAMIEPTV